MARKPNRLAPRARATAPSPAFDRLYLAVSVFFTGGLFLDGWAHNHILNAIESFFTPWHAVFYAGYFGLVAVLGVRLVLGLRRGFSWRKALPPGYDLSLIGAAIFFVGGFGDLVWHTLFGVEASVEALLSPTHLVLAVGGTLLGTGPLRAAWRRRGAISPWTGLLSATTTFSAFTFMTQFAHPTHTPWAAWSIASREFPTSMFLLQCAGISGLMLQAVFFSALGLFLVRRWRMPFGAFTVILGLNALAMSFMQDEFRQIPAFLAAGLAADLLYRSGQPSDERRGALRTFAFALPALIATFQFLSIFLTDQVWWSIHLWAGSIALSGLVGLLLSYVAAPPPAQNG
jgi:hypothetical protein